MNALRNASRIVVLSFALLLAGGIQAQAAPGDKAGVVFSNGGRILTMHLDGDGREVIFGEDRSPKNDERGAIEPEVSPDGETVVFGLKRETRRGEVVDIWRVGVDGSGAKRLLKSGPRQILGDPSFSPDGRVAIAFVRTGKKFVRTGVLSVGPDDGTSKTLLNLTRTRRPYRSLPTVMEPELSPDGKKILYVRNSGYSSGYFDEGFENSLMVLDRMSGRTRKVAEHAYDAAWSPDGKRIVYSEQNGDDDLEICWWESDCRFQSSLVVIGADGSGKRYLTVNRSLDERSPDWSEDGRIVFQSARNVPAAGEAYEIFTIRPDGSCLTQLSNGSPASVQPAWIDGGMSGAPRACGSPPPEAVMELRLPRATATLTRKLWLGPKSATRLLSGVQAIKGLLFSLYIDCSVPFPARCGRPLGLLSSDVCFDRGSIAETLSSLDRLRKQRGVPVFRDTGAEIGPFVLVYSGGTVNYFFGGSGRGARLGEEEVDLLRNFGTDNREGGDLPPAKFPARDLRMIERVSTIYELTGDLAATARRVGRSTAFVRENLRASRQLARFGEYEPVNCGRKS